MVDIGSALLWLLEVRLFRFDAGPHVLASAVTGAAILYVGVFKLERSNVFSRVLTVGFMGVLFLAVHEFFFNPIVDAWNLFTDPQVMIDAYLKGSYPLALLQMFVAAFLTWYMFFQGEFSIRKGGRWWYLWAAYCGAWLVAGFHTSLPFWFQDSSTWPWTHDLQAHLGEFLFTTTFALAFVHCWKPTDNSKVRGLFARHLR